MKYFWQSAGCGKLNGSCLSSQNGGSTVVGSVGGSVDGSVGSVGSVGGSVGSVGS